MKKTIKIVALLLVATLALAALVACGPSTDPEKTKKVLEEKGYKVTIEKDQEEFAYVYEFFGLKDGDVKASLYATNEKADAEEKHLTIIYCKDSSVAKKLWENNDFSKVLQGSRGRYNSIIWVGMSDVWDDAQ